MVPQVHFYKLDDHIYLKPKYNELLPSTAHLAVPPSPEPITTYNASPVLVSIPQAECRHMPQSMKGGPPRGGKCFFTWCYASIIEAPQKISASEKVAQKKSTLAPRAGMPRVNISDKSISPVRPHSCSFISSGLDHHSGLLASLPDSIPCTLELCL